MEIIIVLISRLLAKKDAYNLIKNATIIDKGNIIIVVDTNALHLK